MELPENWPGLTRQEKKNWFYAFCLHYAADGEPDGLREDVSEEIRREYRKLKEEEYA